MNNMIESLIIREFRPDDWNYIKDIYQQGLDTNIATFQTECPTFDDWDSGHLQDCRFVAVFDGKVIAFVVLSPTSKREVYRGVVEVSIYLDLQYTKLGIGTKLFNHLIKAAERNGYWSLYSSIIDKNVASIALHKKCGFREIGFREKIAKDRFGNWHNTILLERRSCLI
ncbi:MAG: N-acetyltransferase family protein [Lachnotalea sp.]